MRTAFFLPFFLLAGTVSSQQRIDWNALADVTFQEKYFADFGTYFLVPRFGKTPRALEGQEVFISGYVIPLDHLRRAYILSRYPYASCFFCGQAGPETIVEIQFNPEKLRRRSLKADEYVAIRGRLRLNAGDVNHFNYILEDAEVMEGRGGDR